MFPLQFDFNPIGEKFWPARTYFSKHVQMTEQICQTAFQTAYDCHFIPREFGGATCPCLDDAAVTWNCPTWYSTMLWGTWFLKPTNRHTVPMDNFNETNAICRKAFQQSYDCTEIELIEGGGKGSCYAGYCQNWFNRCANYEGDPAIEAVHKDSVMSEVRERMGKHQP